MSISQLSPLTFCCDGNAAALDMSEFLEEESKKARERQRKAGKEFGRKKKSLVSPDTKQSADKSSTPDPLPPVPKKPAPKPKQDDSQRTTAKVAAIAKKNSRFG